MWVNDVDGFTELFKYLPYYMLVALPIFIIVSPANPVMASHEFSAYRMQQYDLHNVPYGSRGSQINLEGRYLTSWSTSRHCVVARMTDLTIDQFLNIRSKAGGLLLIMPKSIADLTPTEIEHIKYLENAMNQQEVTIPVYFLKWSEETEQVLQDLENSFITDEKSGTALEAMLNSASANGYQIVTTAVAPNKIEPNIPSYSGKLYGSATNPKVVVVAAHLDASGLTPDLSYNADSATGAVVLLEIARIFSNLYSSIENRPQNSLMFTLLGAGHQFNYFSLKRWLDHQLDAPESNFQKEVSVGVCIERVGGSDLRAHVSRAEGTGSLLARAANATIQHKKVNLADETLAWPHERFSIRRMHAVTFSSLQSHKENSRGTILDVEHEDTVANLVDNTQRIAIALAAHLYNLTGADEALYKQIAKVDAGSIEHWFRYLSSQPRAVHVTVGHTPGIHKVIHRALTRYLGEVAVHSEVVDKREPELAIYGPTQAVINLYSVKPAVFDLIMTLMIGAYLSLVYFSIIYFPNIFSLVANQKIKDY